MPVISSATFVGTAGPGATITTGATSASFTAVSALAPFVVSSLRASSICSGQAIRLTWNNPTGTVTNKIVRRIRAWPFDLTDSYDVVYEGPAVTSFIDSGIKAPITTLSAPAVVGATSVTVVNATGFSIGDTIRIEKLTGPVTFDLVTISNIVGNVLTISPLAHAYAVGDRVAESTVLQPQTYYYYLVLCSGLPAPVPSYDIADASRDFALSIAVMDTKGWLKRHTPKVYLERDAQPLPNGGGGQLDKWYTVMGCWLALMRGQFNAIQLLNDPDKSPFHALPAQNVSLGIAPEGLGYDYDILRRPLTALVDIYHKRGSCPGIIETVRMFTKWNALCVDLGANGCNTGTSDLKTYDGHSIVQYDESFGLITQVVTAPNGLATWTDSTQAWTTDQWINGKARGWIGDIACIAHNTATTLQTGPVTSVGTLSAGVTAGISVIPLSSTLGLYPGMDIQLTANAPVSGAYPAEVQTILSVNPGVSITLMNGTANAYPSGSMVSIQKSIVRAEYLGTATGVAGQVITDANALFVQFAWIGYKLLDSANVVHNVTGSTGNTITVDGAAPATGPYSIARDFVLGANFAARTPKLRLKLLGGEHSADFEPTLDIQERGTLNDPYNRLWMGPGSTILGVWGPGDIGVYITTSVTQTQGRASTVSVDGNTIALDATTPAPAAGALVGMYLNPNQNQTQMFQIIANTTTTITVLGPVTSLLVPGQPYYVLTPRDRVRYQRLTDRLKTEFMDSDARPHVLFL